MQLKRATFEKFRQRGRFEIPKLVEKQFQDFRIEGDVCTISMAEIVDSAQCCRIIAEAQPKDLLDVDSMGRTALYILAYTGQTHLIPQDWVTQQGLVASTPESAGWYLDSAWCNTPLHCIAYQGQIEHLPKHFLTSANLLDLKNSAGKSPMYYLIERNGYKNLPFFSTILFGATEAVLNETLCILNSVRAHLELAKIHIGECRGIDTCIREHAHQLTLETIAFLDFTQNMPHLQPRSAWQQL